MEPSLGNPSLTGTFNYRWSPGTAVEGSVRYQLPASNWAPSHQQGCCGRKPGSLLVPSSYLTPANSGLIPLTVDPCSAASGPTRPTSFPSRTRLSCSMAASLPEREPPTLYVSVSAARAQPCHLRPLWGYCTRSTARLPGRGGDTDHSAWS